jgi:hypothetical protein
MRKIELCILKFLFPPSPAYTKIKIKENITLLQTTGIPYVYFRYTGNSMQETITIYKRLRTYHSEILEI